MKPWNKAYTEAGWFVRRGIGGSSVANGRLNWTIAASSVAMELPSVLLDIDLRDPALGSALSSSDVPSRLPVMTCVKSDLWEHRQEYTFVDDAKEIRWISALTNGARAGSTNDMLVGSDQRSLVLERMTDTDLPTTEARYWAIGERFLGGNDFVRLLGSPYWLTEPMRCKCSCGGEMKMTVCVGSEGATREPLFGHEPFFIGEAALYWFVCWPCRRVVVLPQST